MARIWDERRFALLVHCVEPGGSTSYDCAFAFMRGEKAAAVAPLLVSAVARIVLSHGFRVVLQAAERNFHIFYYKGTRCNADLKTSPKVCLSAEKRAKTNEMLRK